MADNTHIEWTDATWNPIGGSLPFVLIAKIGWRLWRESRNTARLVWQDIRIEIDGARWLWTADE